MWRTSDMRTFYIPTSSLNFNNILSSESISPKAFYQVRSFGYGRWASTTENPFENSIVLFDQYRSFSRPLSDLEDHPLLIEVVLDDEEISKLIALDEHVYLSNHTIYLNPFSTRFIFFNENDMRVTLSLSDSSIETKCVQLYRKRMIAVEPCPAYYDGMDLLPEKQTLDLREVEKDKRLNRMKGLLYGYYIGAILSTTKENIERLNAYREIRDIMAAILSSFDHMATVQQKERLKILYSLIQPEIPFFTKLAALVPEKPIFDEIVALVRREFGSIRGEINVDSQISQLLAGPIGGDAINPIIENINMAIRDIEGIMKRESRAISTSDSQIIVFDGTLSEVNIDGISKTDKILYKAWINDVLSKDEYTGRTSTFKEQLSDDITIKAKEVCEVEWRGSYPEVTLNALRKHVRGGEYNHQWGNDIYSSVSAVVICGDDWQKMLQFMQSKGMTDYKFAFSMYGTINGFANLHRDFTDVLFGCDRKYIGDVYKEFYGQLFDKNVIVSSTDVQSVVVESTSIEIQQIGAVENGNNEIGALLKTIKYGKRQQTLSAKVIDGVCEVYNEFGGHPTALFYKKIQKIRGVGDEAVKAIQEVLGVVSEDLFSQANIEQSEIIQPSKLSFVADDKAVEIVDQLQIRDEEVVQVLKDDIKYIQERYRKIYNVNDKDCLYHLRKLIFSDKWSKHLKQTPNNLQIVEQLVWELTQRYI